MDIYTLKHLANKAERTQAEYKRMFEIHLAKFAKRRLSAISYKEVDRLHAAIGSNHGKYAANRVTALLKSLYSWLIKKRHYEGENPAYGIEMFKEKARDRFLKADELPKFFDSLAQEENKDIRDYVLMSLLTGARKQNVLSMEWSAIDFTSESWTIENTKNQEPLVVPLIPAAIEILRDRQAKNAKGWVFPSTRKKSKTGHLSDPKRGWKRIIERAGIDNLRIHDLRRSMGSWQAINQTSLTVIGKSLGQKSIQSTAIYARLSIDPVRESMEQAARSMFEHGETKKQKTSKVINLKK